jgi:hypothetical protein
VDLEALAVVGFAGFTTDVVSDQSGTLVNRTTDGDVITLAFDSSEDVNGVFVVRTNATAFEESQTLAIEIDFPPSSKRVSQFFATFQPSADAGPGPGPTPVPLPPAAASAIAAGAALALARAARHGLGCGAGQL